MNPRVFLHGNLHVGQAVEVTGDDGHHFARVLRVSPGEAMAVAADRQGFVGTVTDVDGKSGIVRIQLEQELPSHESETRVYVVQGLAKGDKIDTVLQHNTELGVAGFLLLAASRSVVRLEDKKASSKLERWRKVVKEAASQSQRDVIPDVQYASGFHEATKWCGELNPDLVLFLDEDESETGLASVLDLLKNRTACKVVLVIGPEGGWTDDERTRWQEQAHAVRTSLGRRTLRTETAGLVAATAVLHHFRELGG